MEGLNWLELVSGYSNHQLMFGASPECASGFCGRWGLIYLASPYSKQVLDESGAWCRYRSMKQQALAAVYAERFAQLGVTALSPIVLSAEICHLPQVTTQTGLDPLDQTFWNHWCRPLLAACDIVYIPDFPGWRESAGVLFEASEVLCRNGRVFVEADLSR